MELSNIKETVLPSRVESSAKNPENQKDEKDKPQESVERKEAEPPASTQVTISEKAVKKAQDANAAQTTDNDDRNVLLE